MNKLLLDDDAHVAQLFFVKVFDNSLLHMTFIENEPHATSQIKNRLPDMVRINARNGRH